MKMIRPRSLAELAQAMKQKTENSYLVAGCTDFLTKRNGTAWTGDALIDLLSVPELRQLSLSADSLYIGAACTHSQIEQDPSVRRYFPALAQACGGIGSVQIRNRGTLGGNLCNASPAGDTYPALLVLGASALVMDGDARTRAIPVSELILGPGMTCLAPDEVLLGVQLPLPAPEAVSAFGKLGERKYVSIAKISLAVSLRAGNGIIQDAAVALGAVAGKAFLSEAAAACLKQKPLGSDLNCIFGAALSEEIQRSIPDRASMPYKKEAVYGLAEDVLTRLQSSTEEMP